MNDVRISGPTPHIPDLGQDHIDGIGSRCGPFPKTVRSPLKTRRRRMAREGTGRGQPGGEGLRSPCVGRLLRSHGLELGGQLKVAGFSQQDPALEESD